MGRTASSSKIKSSKKKKTSKISSEARRSKRSKRNNKSKKLLRRDDSSSYSADDSTSSTSVLSSSSEDDYRSRRARSRKQTNLESKKRTPRRSPSRDRRSKDAMRIKKNRGAKRKRRDYEAVKKRKYKKSRRDTSVSSRSSDSRSRSSSSTSSSGESEFEKRRGRSRERKKDKGDLGKPRSGNKKGKNRSLSCSSFSRSRYASGDESEEKMAVEVNSRRLRSVITVAKRAEERDENEGKKDVHTDEIVYEHDDYPSRSNDSNDGANKRELVHQSCVESNERIRVENVLGQEDSDSKLTKNEFTISTTNPKKGSESGVSATVDGSSDGQDLESILRQKALENLKRFRGGSQTNEKPRADESVQSKSPKKYNSVLVGAPKFAGPKLSRDSSFSMRTEGKILEGKESLPTQAEGKILDGKESFSTRGEIKISDGSNRGIEPESSQSESSLSKSMQESLGAGSTLKPEHVSLASPNAIPVVNKSSVNKGAGETSQTLGGNSCGVAVNDAGGSTGTEPVSRVEPSSEEHGSRERQDQVKDSSQFQQKTMSVMRGGEMVQVSYKVYIPKKAPALARRQLQR